MKKFFTLIAVAVIVFAAQVNGNNFLPMDTFTYEAGGQEPPVVYLVLVDQDGVEHMFELIEGPDGNFVRTVTLDYDPWGSFYWDFNLTEEENNANRPDVPFYFLINGVRYGADEAMVDAYLGNPIYNPLTNEVEDGFYTVPVGFTYYLGVAVVAENVYYAYAAARIIVGVDEMNASKTVTSQRYFNVAGQEMQEANDLTIVVTTYTDGTTSTVKVVK